MTEPPYRPGSALTSTLPASNDNPVFEILYFCIAPLMGRLIGRKAIELACGHAGLDPRTLRVTDLELLGPKLRPMMVPLLGSAATARVLADVQTHLRGGKVR